jgi:RNA polymerase sigma-70 factor (ECF subfamily)
MGDPVSAPPEAGRVGPSQPEAATVRRLHKAPPSLEALFKAHFKDVYRIVRRLLGPGAGHDDIEDLTQQVFVQAHRSLSRFRGESKPTTWLYTIAIRVVFRHLESWRKNRQLRAALEERIGLETLELAEHRLEQRERLFEAWRLLMKLKPKKRIVFLLHELEGRTGPEIAALLDIPEKTAWTRLFYARKELSALVEGADRRLGG